MKIAINGNGIWQNSVSSISPQQLRTEGNTFKLIKGIQENHNGLEFEQTPGDSEGQGSLACYSPWGHKESDTTQRLNNNKKSHIYLELFMSYYSQFYTRTIF